MLVHATEPRAPVHFDCPRCLPCLVNVDTTFDGPGAGNLIGCVVKKNDDGALYALFAIIGACSVALLPIAIELGAELTRNADGSSATLWFFGNLMCIIFILAQGALRAPSTANPPLNMHRSIIFNGAWCFTSSFFVFFLHGRQVRRERDVAMQGAEQLSEEAGAEERA